jgi:hypothetical protein
MLATLPCPSAQANNQAPLVDATGSRRRLQALGYTGYSIDDLAYHLGELEDLVQRVQDGRADQLPAAVTVLISAAYDALWDVWGGDDHAAWLARGRRYAPPLAWDDNPGDPHWIDDPGCPASMWQRRGVLGPRICGRCEAEIPAKRTLCDSCSPSAPAGPCERCGGPVRGRGRYCGAGCRALAIAAARRQSCTEDAAEAGPLAVLHREVSEFDLALPGMHWRAGAPLTAAAS